MLMLGRDGHLKPRKGSQNNARSVSSDREDKERHAVCWPEKSLGCAVTPTTCRTRPEERPRTSEVSCYLYNARHGKTDGDACMHACSRRGEGFFLYKLFYIIIGGSVLVWVDDRLVD